MIMCGKWYGFFFFKDTATTEIYPLPLHDALPIWVPARAREPAPNLLSTFFIIVESFSSTARLPPKVIEPAEKTRSEEHTSELQSRQYLVCRLLLEKKKITTHYCVRTRHYC